MERKKEAKILSDAVEVMGRAQLAQRMHVTEAVIASWLDGSAVMGDKDLLALSKDLLDWSGKQNFRTCRVTGDRPRRTSKN